MAGPPNLPSNTPSPLLNWVDIPEPPAEVEAVREARVKRLTPIIATISACMIGLVGAFATITLWRGSANWAASLTIERFVIIAVPLAIADYFLSLYLLRYVAKATNLKARRLAISGGKLCMELATGGRWDPPLKSVYVSTAEVASGWYSLTIQAGRTAAECFVPASVASMIAAAKTA